ncbi:MAG: helix-turn-helix domain-containing protein [Azospirillaceae bacterium]|nr:helix-turn-helix domain-containing protein [Azospirillaceae bacterium]
MIDDTETETLAQRLERLMKAAGHSSRSLSLAAGLNATAVRDIVKGRSEHPLISTVQALAAALAVDPTFLAGGDRPYRSVAPALDRRNGAKDPAAKDSAIDAPVVAIPLDRDNLRRAIVAIETYLQSTDTDLPPKAVADLVLRLHDWHARDVARNGSWELTASHAAAWIEDILDLKRP